MFETAVDSMFEMTFARKDGQDLKAEVMAGLQAPATILWTVAPTDLQDVLQDANEAHDK